MHTMPQVCGVCRSRQTAPMQLAQNLIEQPHPVSNKSLLRSEQPGAEPRLHERRQLLSALDWHGVVHRRPHAAHRAVALQLHLQVNVKPSSVGKGCI